MYDLIVKSIFASLSFRASRCHFASLSFMLRMSLVVVCHGGGWSLLSEDSISGGVDWEFPSCDSRWKPRASISE